MLSLVLVALLSSGQRWQWLVANEPGDHAGLMSGSMRT
jgi:hypothetical protein